MGRKDAPSVPKKERILGVIIYIVMRMVMLGALAVVIVSLAMRCAYCIT